MNKLLPLLILLVTVALFYSGLNGGLAVLKARGAIRINSEAFRGGGSEGHEAVHLADVNVGAVASDVGPSAASHQGLGRYGWNALDNSAISATKFCHHDYDCASNRCSALGVCV